MNPQSQNPIDSSAAHAEATLRLIAALPAPAGLEDRIHSALQSSLGSALPQARGTGRVLAWRTPSGSGNSWMRSAAAAAIAFVIAGGGWGVYSRVRLPGRVVAVPVRVAAPGGFGGAGAIRTPQTLNGPVLTHPPVLAHSLTDSMETKKNAKKAVGKREAAPKTAAAVTPAAQ